MRYPAEEELWNRIDSGDLAYLSKLTRCWLLPVSMMLPFPHPAILMNNLYRKPEGPGCQDQFLGRRNKLITADNNPAFGGVYKLAAVKDGSDAFQPKIKLSENTEKVTNPGNKTVYRIWQEDRQDQEPI